MEAATPSPSPPRHTSSPPLTPLPSAAVPSAPLPHARAYRIRARWIRFDAAPNAALLGSMPRHGLGTQDVPSSDALGAYVSVALLVLGFYCYVPWLVCVSFARHESAVARAAAALSVLALLVVGVAVGGCVWQPHALECATALLSWAT